MAHFIPANSNLPTQEIQPRNGRSFQLHELYQLLSCTMIECISLSEGNIMVIDEEGKLFGKSRNQRATKRAGFVSVRAMVAELLRQEKAGTNVFWDKSQLTDMSREADYIAGDALICSGKEFS